MIRRPALILRVFTIMEVWKKIEGFENYEVSNYGNVKSLNYNRMGLEKVLSPSPSRGGYLQIGLYKNGIGKVKKIHQLVAITFLNHTPCGMELVINHINFIKTDNRVENLEVITQRENTNQKHLKTKRTSIYRGVYWCKKANKWKVQTQLNGKNKYLGLFTCEKEAGNAYLEFIKNL